MELIAIVITVCGIGTSAQRSASNQLPILAENRRDER